MRTSQAITRATRFSVRGEPISIDLSLSYSFALSFLLSSPSRHFFFSIFHLFGSLHHLSNLFTCYSDASVNRPSLISAGLPGPLEARCTSSHLPRAYLLPLFSIMIFSPHAAMASAHCAQHLKVEMLLGEVQVRACYIFEIP